MKRVAVLGGGPAGAFAAERLASAGLRTVLFDEKLAWEKPCGGGLTYKAYEKYPFLLAQRLPQAAGHRDAAGRVRAPATRRMKLRQPLVIYSRYDLNRMLLERAERAGAQIEKTRVLGLSRARPRLAACAPSTAPLEADFCIVATGARNPLREVGTQLTAGRHHAARWATTCPRSRSTSTSSSCRSWKATSGSFRAAGISRSGSAARASRRRSCARAWKPTCRSRGISWKDGSFYSHVLPSLATPAWRQQPRGRATAGSPWATRAAWWIPSPAKACTTRCAPATWPARWCSPTRTLPRRSRRPTGRCCSATSPPDLEFGAALARRLFRGSSCSPPCPSAWSSSCGAAPGSAS